MSLLEQVRQAAAKKSALARANYVAALRSGKADSIAKAAAEAAIGEQQLAADIAVGDEARRLTVATANVLDLRAAKAVAEKAAADAADEYNRVVGDLRAKLERARLDFAAIDAQVNGSEAELKRLVDLYQSSDLLDLASAPETVQDAVARDVLGNARTKEISDAMTKIVGLRTELKTAEARLVSVRQQRTVGGWRTLDEDESPELQTAQRLHDETKAAFEAAKAKYEALRNGAVPATEPKE